MAALKSTKKKPSIIPSTIRSLSITKEDANILDKLAQEASDYIGWTVSGSAIVRALLRQADQQPGEWFKEQIFPFIEQEIQEGTVWGKKK